MIYFDLFLQFILKSSLIETTNDCEELRVPNHDLRMLRRKSDTAPVTKNLLREGRTHHLFAVKVYLIFLYF